MLQEQTKIIKMQRQMLFDQKKAGLHMNEGEEEELVSSGGGGGENKDFASLRTDLPRLTFNTHITIKTKKRDGYV